MTVVVMLGRWMEGLLFFSNWDVVLRLFLHSYSAFLHFNSYRESGRLKWVVRGMGACGCILFFGVQ